LGAGDAGRGPGLRPQLEGPVGALRPRRLAALADLEVLAGQHDAARATAARVRAIDPADSYVNAMADYATARAAEADGDMPAAAEAAARAVVAFDGAEAGFEAARARLLLARAA